MFLWFYPYFEFILLLLHRVINLAGNHDFERVIHVRISRRSAKFGDQFWGRFLVKLHYRLFGFLARWFVVLVSCHLRSLTLVGFGVFELSAFF